MEIPALPRAAARRLTILEQETGRDIYDALESALAKPIAMQDFDRSLQIKEGDLTKSMHAAYPMWFSTRDMARIGHLMLHEGNWAGRQVVPRDWAITYQVPEGGKKFGPLQTPSASVTTQPIARNADRR